jgi:hypothetical protein
MTKAERLHKTRLAEIGCALCFRIHPPHEPGPVELHHLRGGGWGKGDYTTLIPLCVQHHRGHDGIHHLGVKLWERQFDVSQKELLQWSKEQIKC